LTEEKHKIHATNVVQILELQFHVPMKIVVVFIIQNVLKK